MWLAVNTGATVVYMHLSFLIVHYLGFWIRKYNARMLQLAKKILTQIYDNTWKSFSPPQSHGELCFFCATIYLPYKLNGPYHLRPFLLAARNQHKYRICTELYHVSWAGTLWGRIKGAKYRFDLQFPTWDFSWDAVAGKGFILRWRGSHVVFLTGLGMTQNCMSPWSATY